MAKQNETKREGGFREYQCGTADEKPTEKPAQKPAEKPAEDVTE
jgi:hypothetical protein